MRIQSPIRFPSVCSVPSLGSSLGRGGQMLLSSLSEMYLDVLAFPGQPVPSFCAHTNVHIRHRTVTMQSSIHEVLERVGGLNAPSDADAAGPSSVQFSCSVMSDSLWPHGLLHTRPPCPSSNPRVYSNSCPLSWWCHPTISSSVIPFSSCLQPFPASGSFTMC